MKEKEFIIVDYQKVENSLFPADALFFKDKKRDILHMKKFMIIGCPGSGKSTFARKLSEITGIPAYHLDMLYWTPDRKRVEKEVFMSGLSSILEKDKWIIDGNYQSSLELRMQECDTIIFLDYPLKVCLEGIEERKFKPRTDIPWVEKKGEETDKIFLEYVKNFNTDCKPEIMDLLKKYAYKTVHIFTNRDLANFYLSLWELEYSHNKSRM